MEKQKKGSTEKLFENFGKNIDQFLGELDEANIRLQKIFRERLTDLKKASNSLKKEAKNKERWDTAETALKQSGKELKKAFTIAFGKAKKPSGKGKKKTSPPRKAKPKKTATKSTRKESPKKSTR